MLRPFQTHQGYFPSWTSPKFSEPQALGSCCLYPEVCGTDTHLSPAVLSLKNEERKGAVHLMGKQGAKQQGTAPSLVQSTFTPVRWP